MPLPSVIAEYLSPTWWVTYLVDFYKREPYHLIIEILAIAIILYLVFSPPYNPNDRPLTKQEQDKLIAEWEPEPLVSPATKRTTVPLPQPHIVQSEAGPLALINNKEYLNLASYNFLGLASSKIIKNACAKIITDYGVGSCGPRGFYGTIDVHLRLERAFAKFMGTEDSILYSDGIALMPSAIPAFAKQGDLLICDQAVNNAIQMGAKLSRSNVLYFKHNDMRDLDAILATMSEKEHKRAKLHRKFIVVEGIYQYTGDICPLKEIVTLAKKYRFRVILDDSLALGVLGKTGRGSYEHWGLNVTDVDMICATMDASLATVGGLCVGSKQIIDHQRLSGAGYCFSAASPPYTAEAGTMALGLIDANPNLTLTVRSKAATFRKALSQVPYAIVSSGADSPVVHLRIATGEDIYSGTAASSSSSSSITSGGRSVEEQLALLLKINDYLFANGIVGAVPRYLHTERAPPRPSIRFTVTAEHADADLKTAAGIIAKAFAEVVGSASNGKCAIANASSSSSSSSSSALSERKGDNDEEEALAEPTTRRRSVRSRSRKD